MSVYESDAGPVELDEPIEPSEPATEAQLYGPRRYVGYMEDGNGSAFTWAGRLN